MYVMLNPYRRHSDKCPHEPKGRAYRQCKCVVWVEGTLNGERIQKSLKTRDWKKAQDSIHKMELRGKVEEIRYKNTSVASWSSDCLRVQRAQHWPGRGWEVLCQGDLMQSGFPDWEDAFGFTQCILRGWPQFSGGVICSHHLIDLPDGWTKCARCSFRYRTSGATASRSADGGGR